MVALLIGEGEGEGWEGVHSAVQTAWIELNRPPGAKPSLHKWFSSSEGDKCSIGLFLACLLA